MMPENGPGRMNSEGESCHSGKVHLPFAAAATQAAPQAIQVADRFHLCENVADAVQLLLARVLPEIQSSQQEKADQPVQQESLSRPVQEWRPAPRKPGETSGCHPARRAAESLRSGRQLARTRADRSTNCTSARHDRTDDEALAPAGDPETDGTFPLAGTSGKINRGIMRRSSSSSSTLFVGTFCKGRVGSVGASDICVVCGSLWLVSSSKGACSRYPQRPQKSEAVEDFSPQARQNGMILIPHPLKNFSIIDVLLKSKNTTQAIF